MTTMTGKSVPKLPIINLKNVKQGTSTWMSTSKDVQNALEEYGCFVASFDKVSQELDNKVFDVIQQLFQLPLDVKARNSSNIPCHGYHKLCQIMPLLESFGIENAPNLEGTQKFTNILWPNGNDQFCETVQQYAKQASKLEQLVTSMMFDSYGLSKYMDDRLNSTTYLLRIAEYKAPNKDDAQVGGIAHTDKNFITIIHQNEIDGLEIQTKDGDWISYESFPHSFVVMAGESLLAWSNNRIHAPIHRVMMKGNKPRYSLSLFSRSEGILKIPTELVEDDKPLQFKPFDYVELLKFYNDDLSKMARQSIKEYCGV